MSELHELVKIRAEGAGDIAGIRAVHVAAFADEPYSQQTEHLIVDELRAAGALRVSLVAECEARVVGHIAFSPVMIDGVDLRWYALGPVGVLPPMQRQGIGSRLVRAGLDHLRRFGAEGCVLVGESAYYERFGFRQCDELTMDGFPGEVQLCLALQGSEPRGRVEHHPAFSVQASGDAAR